MDVLGAVGRAEAGAEVHHAVAVVGTAVLLRDDLQAEPSEGEAGAQAAHVDPGPFQRMGGADNECGVAADEGAVAGAHQLHRGRRLGAGVEGAAAGIVGCVGAAGTAIHDGIIAGTPVRQ